jgi:hypothetical protein
MKIAKSSKGPFFETRVGFVLPEREYRMCPEDRREEMCKTMLRAWLERQISHVQRELAEPLEIVPYSDLIDACEVIPRD